MASIDFSFITDNCRYDQGELRAALEALCAVAEAPISVLDPNAGGCGAWGPTGTVTEVSYDAGLKQITIGGQEASTAYLLSALMDNTFAPAVDITPLGTYLGATINVVFNNPSVCDSVLFVGNIYNTNILEFGSGKLHRLELRDISLGAPGPLIGDLQGQYNLRTGDSVLREEVHTIPFNVIVPPGGSINITYRGEIVTAATVGGALSQWFQNQIQLIAIGVPI